MHEDLLLNPSEHVVTGTVLIITQVVVQAQVRDLTRLEEFYGFFGPKGVSPAVRRGTYIVEEDFHREIGLGAA